MACPLILYSLKEDFFFSFPYHSVLIFSLSLSLFLFLLSFFFLSSLYPPSLPLYYLPSCAVTFSFWPILVASVETLIAAVNTTLSVAGKIVANSSICGVGGAANCTSLNEMLSPAQNIVDKGQTIITDVGNMNLESIQKDISNQGMCAQRVREREKELK